MQGGIRELLFNHLTTMDSVFYHDVANGLSLKQKKISSKYLYDANGSNYFEEICELKEYYITRAEIEILKNNSEDIVEVLGGKICLIEPGAGNGVKVQYLFEKMLPPLAYVPVEISKSILEVLKKDIAQKYPKINLHPILGDFNNQEVLKKIASLKTDFNKIIFFPGSTIGNLEIQEALDYLKKMAHLSNNHEKLGILLGVDIVKKDTSFIEKAYNDQKGVTANFNKNLLVRMNRELNSDFKVEKFKHLAFFNQEKSRIEMHLQSLEDQVVWLGDKKIRFKKDETIHTENSYKYDLKVFSKNLDEINLKLKKVWYDSKKLFSFCYITSK